MLVELEKLKENVLRGWKYYGTPWNKHPLPLFNKSNWGTWCFIEGKGRGEKGGGPPEPSEPKRIFSGKARNFRHRKVSREQ